MNIKYLFQFLKNILFFTYINYIDIKKEMKINLKKMHSLNFLFKTKFKINMKIHLVDGNTT